MASGASNISTTTAADAPTSTPRIRALSPMLRLDRKQPGPPACGAVLEVASSSRISSDATSLVTPNAAASPSWNCCKRTAISSGMISETPGRLPARKTTEPYSPTPRAKANAAPATNAGSKGGRMTRRKSWLGAAPSVIAASCTAGSSAMMTGCSVRTMKGRPTKASATPIPSGVKATCTPTAANGAPNQPSSL